MMNYEYLNQDLDLEEPRFTVFPNDEDESPSDFHFYKDALMFGNEMFGEGNYTIEEIL